MYSRDINDSTYFTIVKMNGNHTPCYHYLEYCQKRLISNSAEPRAFLLLSVNPSSHPHPNKNFLKNKKRDSLYTFSSEWGEKDPHHAESATVMKWTLEYSEGISVLDSSVLYRLQHTQQLVTACGTTTTLKPTKSGSITHPAQLLFTKTHALDLNH